LVSDAQVRKLMSELDKHGRIGLAALRAGMDRKTARRYRREGALPSELKPIRSWRTRENPFAADWDVVKAMLEAAPEFEAKTIFEHLVGRSPGRYQEGQLRTLQRHIRQWRAQEGPPKEVFFPQLHRPGEAMQTDFTWGTELGVTIQGVPFPHLLCHSVLPYSNWQWATVCGSESIEALKRGMQATLFRLVSVPVYHQTDNSTAATHQDLGSTTGRAFNREYEEICKHFEVEPRTIGVGEKEQNGDIEAANGALKRRIEQHLLIRGSRDFESRAAYESWVQAVCEGANGLRTSRLAEEVAVMRPLTAARLPAFTEVRARVTSGSTIHVKKNVYSVPSRLLGETVVVRVHEGHLEVFYGRVLQFRTERLRGEGKHRINYRHIIDSMVKKPGAFGRYRYREELFPNLVFRRAYDRLERALGDRQADLNYLRVLQLAKETTEQGVQDVLRQLERTGELPVAKTVEASVAPRTAAVPEMPAIPADLTGYDELLHAVGEVR
jgi:transposase InsO family protein